MLQAQSKNFIWLQLHYPNHDVLSAAKAPCKQPMAAAQLSVLFAIYILMPRCVTSVIPGQNPNSKQLVGGRFSKQKSLVERVSRHSALALLLFEPGFHQQLLWLQTTPTPSSLHRPEQQRRWRSKESHCLWGYQGMEERKSKWTKLLHYYFQLHETTLQKQKQSYPWWAWNQNIWQQSRRNTVLGRKGEKWTMNWKNWVVPSIKLPAGVCNYIS